MQTQHPIFSPSHLPRRLLTDRAYLKEKDFDAASKALQSTARTRLPGTLENPALKDTIIQTNWGKDLYQ